TEFVSADPDETAAREGNTVPGTPETQFTVAVDYTRALGPDFLLDLSLWGNHIDDAFRDIENTVELKSEERFLVNARIGLSSPAGRWSVYAYADNLFDERYITS